MAIVETAYRAVQVVIEILVMGTASRRYKGEALRLILQAGKVLYIFELVSKIILIKAKVKFCLGLVDI